MKVTARQLRKIIKEETNRFLYENKDREAALVARVKQMTFGEFLKAYIGIPVMTMLGDTEYEVGPKRVFIDQLGYSESDVVGDMIKRDGGTGSQITMALTSMMPGILAMEPAGVTRVAAEEEEEEEVEVEEED